MRHHPRMAPLLLVLAAGDAWSGSGEQYTTSIHYNTYWLSSDGLAQDSSGQELT